MAIKPDFLAGPPAGDVPFVDLVENPGGSAGKAKATDPLDADNAQQAGSDPTNDKDAAASRYPLDAVDRSLNQSNYDITTSKPFKITRG